MARARGSPSFRFCSILVEGTEPVWPNPTSRNPNRAFAFDNGREIRVFERRSAPPIQRDLVNPDQGLVTHDQWPRCRDSRFPVFPRP